MTFKERAIHFRKEVKDHTIEELIQESDYCLVKMNAHSVLHDYDEANFYLELSNWCKKQILFKTINLN